MPEVPAGTTATALSEAVELCRSDELVEGGLAVPFDVEYEGENCRAFAIRRGNRYAINHREFAAS